MVKDLPELGFNPKVFILGASPPLKDYFGFAEVGRNLEFCSVNYTEDWANKVDLQDCCAFVVGEDLEGQVQLEIFQFLRNQTFFVNCPIILVSRTEDSQLDLYRAHGFDDCFSANLGFEGLIERIFFQLERSRLQQSVTLKIFESYRKRVVQTLSHEFRTPLVAILTGSDLVLKDLESTEVNRERILKIMGAIKRGGERLDRLINDFMLMQQLEAGIIEKVFESRASWHSVSSLLSHFEEVHREKVNQEGCSLTVLVDGEDFNLYTYDHHLYSILERLISNAVKFTPKGSKVSILAQKQDQAYAVIEVHDEGPGIGQKDLKKSLEAFEQINREINEQQGSGLGLCIANQLVRVNRGRLELENKATGGIAARIFVPLSWI